MKIFVSYARPSATERKALAFKERLESELRLIAPQATVFVDRTMHAGDNFPIELRQQLDGSDALLVLVSPAWLKSIWCRAEFNFFTRHARDENRLRRVVPILWTVTGEVSEESDDVVARTLSQINWADWSALRFRGFGTSAMGSHFATLARALLKAATHPAVTKPSSVPATSKDTDVAETPITPEAAVYGPESDYKKDIRSLMIEALAPDEIHIDRFVFNDSATISDLEAMCTRVLYARRDRDEVQGSVARARRTVYTQKYAIHRLDDEKTALDADHGPWTKYLVSLLASKGITGIEGARVLDVGHGTGQAYAVDDLFRSLRRFTAVDLSEQALSQATHLLPNARTVVADAEELDGVKTASQDLYLSFRTYNSTLFHRRRAVWEAPCSVGWGRSHSFYPSHLLCSQDAPDVRRSRELAAEDYAVVPLARCQRGPPTLRGIGLS